MGPLRLHALVSRGTPKCRIMEVARRRGTGSYLQASADAASLLQARKAPPALQDRSALPDLKNRKDPKVPLEPKAQPRRQGRGRAAWPRGQIGPKAHRLNRMPKDQRVLPAKGRTASADKPGPAGPGRPGPLGPKEMPAPRQRSVSSPGGITEVSG
jgi:hypothetical protein